jgi:hypothetical protein
VPPDGDGGGPVDTVELAQVDFVDEVHATRDGRVVVVGDVDPPDFSGTVFGVAVLDPETGSGPVFPLTPGGESRSVSYSAVSSDGRTLHAVLELEAGDRDVIRVLSLDLGTGEITASHDLEVAEQEFLTPMGIVLAPDGSVTVGIDVARVSDVDGVQSFQRLDRFGADLTPLGEPVTVAGPLQLTQSHGLSVTADGTVLVLVEDPAYRIVALRPDADQAETVLETEDPIFSIEADPAGHWAYVIGGDGPVAVDLTTGELGQAADLCPGVHVDSMQVARGGGSLLVVGYCSREPEWVWRLDAAA